MCPKKHILYAVENNILALSHGLNRSTKSSRNKLLIQIDINAYRIPKEYIYKVNIFAGVFKLFI